MFGPPSGRFSQCVTFWGHRTRVKAGLGPSVPAGDRYSCSVHTNRYKQIRRYKDTRLPPGEHGGLTVYILMSINELFDYLYVFTYLLPGYSFKWSCERRERRQ